MCNKLLYSYMWKFASRLPLTGFRNTLAHVLNTFEDMRVAGSKEG